MYTFVPGWNDSATTPSTGLTVKWTCLIGPKTSLTFPICCLFSKKMNALKYGTFSIRFLHTSSFSHGWMYSPTTAGFAWGGETDGGRNGRTESEGERAAAHR